MPVRSLGREDPLEEGMATTPVFLCGESHGTWEEPGGLWPTEPLRVRHNWSHWASKQACTWQRGFANTIKLRILGWEIIPDYGPVQSQWSLEGEKGGMGGREVEVRVMEPRATSGSILKELERARIDCPQNHQKELWGELCWHLDFSPIKSIWTFRTLRE